MNNKIAYLILGVAVIVAVVVVVFASQETKTDDAIIVDKQKVSLRCNADEECMLIDRDLGFGCGWGGACGSIDYSLNEYIAVNAKSFLALKEKKCGPLSDYGPAPGCPVQIINDNFFAKCISNICEKVPK